MKQVLWKLLPLHWISSAWYTVFSQAAHLAPPPQFGILEEKNIELIHYLTFNQLPTQSKVNNYTHNSFLESNVGQQLTIIVVKDYSPHFFLNNSMSHLF